MRIDRRMDMIMTPEDGHLGRKHVVLKVKVEEKK
jgi:hypothetical protein